MPYWRALLTHLRAALFDVGVLVLFSLLPLVLARLGPAVRREPSPYSDGLFGFFFSGQLALLTNGALATMILLCLRKKLPNWMTQSVGILSIATLFFLGWLIGNDPTLTNAPFTFVGPVSGGLYVAAQIGLVFVLAVSKIDLSDGGKQSSAQTKSLQDDLDKSKNPEQ